jgi:hypothetical protein
MRRSIGGTVEIAIGEPMLFGFYRQPIGKLPHDPCKPLRNRLFNLVPAKLDELTIRVETFGSNILINSVGHKGADAIKIENLGK